MREHALGRDLVGALSTFAAGRGLRRIRHAYIALGTDRDLDVDALRLWFEIAAPGSAAEGAELCIEHQLAQAFCLACGTDVRVRRRGDSCPACGSHRLITLGGPPFRVLDCDGD